MLNIKEAAAFILVASLMGCSSDTPEDPKPTTPVGSDKDAHGCINSAGYLWCSKTKECERPWELAEKAGFANTPSNFDEYCGNK
ncbi:hypothetical protein ACJJI3_09025 [Microbulbifer sp. ZKSA004]|uniref:hypothetical protein n=1 Tax=Microbulbifer sp. ZKSA004 TaxID=3243389 RepID=UPI00403A1818